MGGCSISAGHALSMATDAGSRAAKSVRLAATMFYVPIQPEEGAADH